MACDRLLPSLPGVVDVHKDHRFTGSSHWENAGNVASESYVCGYCGSQTGTAAGWQTEARDAFIRICPHCNGPTFFGVDKSQWPGPKLGGTVVGLSEEVQAIYEEARGSIAGTAYTGAVMLCRKILMHVAVEKGADSGLSFQEYVQWLIGEHYAPRGAEDWLDYIRKRANEANHEIVVMSKQDAVGVLGFTEALLRSVYELPDLVPKTVPERTAESGSETPAPLPEGQ
jgi:hypothetical protein